MILIDADSLVYSCGFATQKSHSRLVVENPDGGVDVAATTNLTDWKREHKGWTVLDREVIVEAEPEGYAIQALRLSLSTIIDACGGGKHRLFISGPGNFREKIATINVYKGNRDKLHKPVHYTALRECLLEQGANLVEGMEADDEVSIQAHEIQSRVRGRSDCIVASIDKDLDQIPGKHYNPMKDEHYEIGRLTAHTWFYRQILTGDSVDNVGGCWRMGPAGADRELESAVSKGQSLWRCCVDRYVDSLAKPGCPYAALGGLAAALENARLVYMLHTREEAEEGKWWTPPTEEK